MGKVPEKRTHFALPIELRFRAIRATWTPGEISHGERMLFPAVSQDDNRMLGEIDDPEEIRRQFFKLEPDEDSALDFLNRVGVWLAVDDKRGREGMDPRLVNDLRVRATRFQGAFGHRYFNGRAVVATVESLHDDQKYWRELCKNRARLRAEFGPPPSGDSSAGQQEWSAIMASFGNTLPVHLEWRGRHPHAVIQPITGWELLIALAWIDLVTGAVFKVCRNPNCGVEYTWGRPKFCSLECERANTKRTYRRRIKQAEAIIRANPNLSINKLLEKLTGAGIKRGPDWVVKAKTRLQKSGTLISSRASRTRAL